MSWWKPDTCECVLEYSKGGNDPDFFTGFLKKCSIHNSINTPQELHDAVLSENQTKNIALGIIFSNCEELMMLDENGKKVRDDSKVSFCFDKDRKLILTANGIELGNKIKSQSDLNNKFGLGKVVVSE